ncbi:hypothetical protein PPYR_07573 [Photinus pyralis]|uniref:ABC transporter domain-containing protein n=1 Tax=Photinus pyralis TaxID=7054 RepID=A0A1Y1NBY8_PHOPY|nr:ATP-binding cassette sub-family G member 1-like [Photinus pyralis]KAB0799693.1 hypothetical protein PPYR_07573 [Photinus pyralis]
MDDNLVSVPKTRPDSLKVELLRIPENDIPVRNRRHECNVGFENLSYSVREGIFRKRRKTILRNISGTFDAGNLTAIMGPSGCGKTTLMNILAGYTIGNVEGELLVNDEPRVESSFKKIMCYIMQDDCLQPLLTVKEVMMIAARLKLPDTVSREEKKLKIQETLEAIGLDVCCDTRTGSLSGGQRKRLSIALELLRNPQVLILDEPTSGLDSSTSKQCIMLLKELSAEGRTVICTIHQPSALLFELFDHLYALAEGCCIYQGSIKGMLPYLADIGLRCPPYHNPADYLLEVANGEHGSFTNELVVKSANGRRDDWKKIHRSTLQVHSMNHIGTMMDRGLITPVKAPPFRFSHSTPRRGSSSCHSPKYPTSFPNQVAVLLKRSFLVLKRDRTLTYSRILTHFATALFIGILYYGIGIDAKDLHNNANFMFFSIMFLMMTSFNCVTLTFPTEVALINKEHFNSWYSIGSYYFSNMISDLPIQMIATLSYALVTFYMTSQPREGFRIMYFLIICILISLVAQSFGMLVGSSWEMKTAIIIGPICFLPFTIFSGFFVQFHDAHPYVQWIFHISYLKYGFEGLMLAILGYEREKLPCEADYCHVRYPQQFLEQMDMENAVYSHCVFFLIGLQLIFRIVTYFVLLLRVRRK